MSGDPRRSRASARSVGSLGARRAAAGYSVAKDPLQLRRSSTDGRVQWEIYQGNALELIDRVPQVNLVVTDPPYSGGATRREWKAGGSVDAALYAAAKRVAEPSGLMLVCSGSSGRSVDRIVGAVAPVLPFAKVLTWVKPFSLSRAAGPWHWHTVLILVFGRLGGRSGQPDYLVAHGMQLKRQGKTPHPAEMPEKVGHWLAAATAGRFDQTSTRGSVVGFPRALDPFCGTGALLAPFFDAGFHCTGFEIDPRWAKLARALRRDARA